MGGWDARVKKAREKEIGGFGLALHAQIIFGCSEFLGGSISLKALLILTGLVNVEIKNFSTEVEGS